jgi:glycosyltransferase involved in cell wall biosynthesis
MKVLMYAVGPGGLWDIAWHLSCQYAKQGIDVILQTTPNNPELGEPPENLRLLDNLLPAVTGKRYLRFKPFWAIDRLLRFNINVLRRSLAIRRFRPAVVHIQNIIPLLDWFWLGLLPRRTPLVCTVHDVIPHRYSTPFQRLENRLKGVVLRSAAQLIVHTDANRKDLIDSFGIEAGRIALVPHGITIPPHTDSDAPANQIPDIPKDARVLLFMGTLRENKGLEVLLAAMPKVVDRLPDALLLVAGSLPRGHTFDRYDRIIDDLAVRENIRLHIGWIEEEKLPLYYRTADLVVLPYTRFHSQSGILLRAYPHKKPVIVTDVGGLGETVRRDETGLVVPPGDSQALTEAIVYLLSDDDLYRRCQEAMANCLNRYSWPSIAEQTLHVYKKCVPID